MERTPMRFAVAGIIHETNTYAAEFSGLTPLAAFEQYWGQRVAEVFDNANHQVGGFIEGARRVGATLDYAFVGQATPSGTIDAAAYASMKREVVEGIRAQLPVDGVLLALHGAGVADGVEDIEGDLASAVRDLVGASVPIAAVYDLHGNFTEAMRLSCDITLPCKLYPHTDFFDRGVEAVALLAQMLDGRLKPVTAVRYLPMLPYIVTTQEGFTPALVNALCARLAAQHGVVDCSWFHGFPYADIAAPCPSVICTTNDDPALAQRLADEVADWIWRHRASFRPSFPSPAEGVAAALATEAGPIVVNEYADNPGGGTPGDGTHLLRALPIDLQQHVAAFAHLVFDPHARRAVIVAMHFRAFEKLAALATLEKLFDRNEVVMHALFLVRTRCARRARDRQANFIVLREQRVHECRLARARGGDHHEQVTGIHGVHRGLRGLGWRGHAGYSRFCTCSRICSM